MKTDERGDLVIIESHGLLPMNRTKSTLYKSHGELSQRHVWAGIELYVEFIPFFVF